MEKQDIDSIVNILARAVENDHDAERIAALNMARIRLRRFNMSLEQLVTGRGSAHDMLKLFQELRQKIDTLQKENDALVRRHQRLFPDDNTPLEVDSAVLIEPSERWQEIVNLAERRYLTTHGHLRVNWRTMMRLDLKIRRATFIAWEEGREEIPQNVIDRLRAIPESPYLEHAPINPETGKLELTARPYNQWSVENLLRLNELAPTDFNYKKIARILTEEFGRHVTPDSVRFQMKSRAMRAPGHKINRYED